MDFKTPRAKARRITFCAFRRGCSLFREIEEQFAARDLGYMLVSIHEISARHGNKFDSIHNVTARFGRNCGSIRKVSERFGSNCLSIYNINERFGSQSLPQFKTSAQDFGLLGRGGQEQRRLHAPAPFLKRRGEYRKRELRKNSRLAPRVVSFGKTKILYSFCPSGTAADWFGRRSGKKRSQERNQDGALYDDSRGNSPTNHET